jgi:hypothetical protein
MRTHMWVVTSTMIAACVGVMTSDAAGISVDVARKCNDLAYRAFPPRVPGNPAAGLENGNGQAARAYVRKCVQNGGRVDTTEGRGQQHDNK